MKSQRQTVERARELRRVQTPFEIVLWNILRDRQLENYKFRRQHPIPPYIADFACLAKKLVIELDGRVHDETVERDRNRDQVIEEQGWRVLRFANVQLLRERENVVRTILHYLEL
ncbi:endonuclease domain-containing protein [bacterium]|nr:MAG: endonuclease domain-containing protein [bacterium]